MDTGSGYFALREPHTLVELGIAWGGFAGCRRGDGGAVWIPGDLTRWEGITSVMTALVWGLPMFFGEEDVLEGVERGGVQFAMVSPDMANDVVARGTKARIPWMFISYPARRSEREWGLLVKRGRRMVLPVFGNASAGPVLSVHPQWVRHDVSGIPVTNVDLWPLDTENHNPLLASWEVINEGVLGVMSPAMMNRSWPEPVYKEWMHGQWLDMGIRAKTDANVLFSLL